MSTLVNVRLQFDTAQRIAYPAKQTSAWLMVDTWIAAIPLLFLVARGTFSFESVATNVPNGGVYGSMLVGSATDGTRYFVEVFLFYAIICGLCLPWYKNIIASFSQHKLIFALPLFAIVSTAWSAVPIRTICYGIMALINTAFAFYLAKRYTRRQQLELLLGLGVIALVSSYLLIVLYPAAAFDHKEGMANAWQGLFGHKNHCAMIMLLLLATAFYIKPTTLNRHILRALYVAATIVLIVMTTSRTGWLLLALTLCFVPFVSLLRRIKQKDRFVVSLLVGTSVLGILLLGLYEAADIAVALGKDPTFSGRTDIWKAVLRPIFKQPVLGYGYYAFWTKQNPEALLTALSIGSTGLGNAENGVLQMWLEMGVVGLGMTFLILAHLVKMGLTAFRRDGSNYIQWCLCMVFLGMLYGLIAGDKFMYPHTIEWTLLVLVYANLHESTRVLRPAQRFSTTLAE